MGAGVGDNVRVGVGVGLSVGVGDGLDVGEGEGVIVGVGVWEGAGVAVVEGMILKKAFMAWFLSIVMLTVLPLSLSCGFGMSG